MFKKRRITTVHTMARCGGCGIVKEREFADGDVLFSEESRCGSCSGMMLIEMIFGETVEY